MPLENMTFEELYKQALAQALTPQQFLKQISDIASQITQITPQEPKSSQYKKEFLLSSLATAIPAVVAALFAPKGMKGLAAAETTQIALQKTVPTILQPYQKALEQYQQQKTLVSQIQQKALDKYIDELGERLGLDPLEKAFTRYIALKQLEQAQEQIGIARERLGIEKGALALKREALRQQQALQQQQLQREVQQFDLKQLSTALNITRQMIDTLGSIYARLETGLLLPTQIDPSLLDKETAEQIKELQTNPQLSVNQKREMIRNILATKIAQLQTQLDLLNQAYINRLASYGYVVPQTAPSPVSSRVTPSRAITSSDSTQQRPSSLAESLITQKLPDWLLK